MEQKLTPEEIKAKLVTKYTLLWITGSSVDSDYQARLSYGEVETYYGQRSTPETEYNSHEAAVLAAYEISKYSNFLVLPVYSFNNY